MYKLCLKASGPVPERGMDQLVSEWLILLFVIEFHDLILFKQSLMS